MDVFLFQAKILTSENQPGELVLPYQSLLSCVTLCLQWFGLALLELEHFQIGLMGISAVYA